MYRDKEIVTVEGVEAGRDALPLDNAASGEPAQAVLAIALVLKEILVELQSINTSLKSIARSQAHQATKKSRP